MKPIKYKYLILGVGTITVHDTSGMAECIMYTFHDVPVTRYPVTVEYKL